MFFSPVNALILLVFVLMCSLLVFYKPLVESSGWRATVTPLASIMGSGFLVCAPLLYANVGNYAVFAMAGLLGLSYALGAVIRYNIAHAEQLLERSKDAKNRRDEHRMHVFHRDAALHVSPRRLMGWLEKASHLVLALAYCVSVSYYLQLLASFVPKPIDGHDTLFGRLLVSVILVGIGAVGTWRGLKGIERVERIVVGCNLAMITALLAGLIYFNIAAMADGSWALASSGEGQGALHTLRLLMGMVIVVQGFETSRFLGGDHSREERIATMRRAQLVAAGIYVAFVGLMAVVFGRAGGDVGTDITAIIDLSGIVAGVLPLLVLITALGSQFSAATADDAGCAGMVESLLGNGASAKYNYVLVSAASLAVTWVTDVYQIINYASRSFAVYYALQCAVAMAAMTARKADERSPKKLLGCAVLGLLCVAVAVFGIPAG